MKAKDIMSSPVITVTPDATVGEIAALLFERRISAVPVVENGRLVGIVSEADLLHRHEIGTDCVARSGSWWLRLFAVDRSIEEYIKSHARQARDIMTREVVSVAPDTAAAQVASVLETHGIKRLPVLDDGRLVGIVSRANLLQGFALSEPTWPMLRDDRQIRDALNKALKEAGLPMHQVNVTVNNGIVRLWGWIDAEVQRKAAHAAAQTTPGVERLEDNLVVSTPALRAGRGYV